MTMRPKVEDAERSLVEQWLSRVWLVQAVYFLVTGVWAVVGLRSFQAISGEKTDLWLVRTVGLLTAVIGGVLAMAGWRRNVTPEVAAMAVGSSAALTAIDLVYGGSGRISRVYLLDALMHAVLVTSWSYAMRRNLLPGDNR